MNILIAHTSPDKSEKIQKWLSVHSTEMHIAYKANNEKELKAAIHGKKGIFYDLAILETGMLTDPLPLHLSSIYTVFTSGRKEDAYRAIKANGKDFLLDPYGSDDVNEVLNKAINHKTKGEKRNYKKRFMVKYGEKIQAKSMKEVACIFADGKLVFIYTPANRRKYIIEHTLDELENKYLDSETFFRINRKYIIRFDAIEEIRNYANSRLKVILNTPFAPDLIVSRAKVQSFKNWLNL